MERLEGGVWHRWLADDDTSVPEGAENRYVQCELADGCCSYEVRIVDSWRWEKMDYDGGTIVRFRLVDDWTPNDSPFGPPDGLSYLKYDLKFRDGEILEDAHLKCSEYRWTLNDDGGDIMHFRVTGERYE